MPFGGIRFTARPRAGHGSLLVLVMEDGADLSKATGLCLRFQSLGRADHVVEAIAAEVRKPVVSYEVVER